MATVQVDGYLERKLLRAGFKRDFASRVWINRFGYRFLMSDIDWAGRTREATRLASSHIFRVRQAARRSRTRAEFACEILYGRRTSKRGARR